MGNTTDYFNRTAYKATYSLGDRVYVRMNKVLCMGTVGNDRLVSLERGPEVTVHLDLPYRDKDNHVHNILVVNHKMVKPMKVFD